jgi:L-proline---[L-prolyl-carrier protein] ligase
MLHDYLRSSAARHAHRTALKLGADQLSYAQLYDGARRFALALWQHDLLPGARVALWLDKELRTYVAVHGALAAGCAYVPIDISTPPARVAWALEDSRAEVFVCRASDLGRISGSLPDSVRLVIAVDGETTASAPISAISAISASSSRVVPWSALEALDPTPYVAERIARDPEALAYVLYTSGSTGTPKGVSLSHRAACAFVDWAADECGVRPTDRLSNCASLSFDLSTFDIFAAARAGACLCPLTSRVLASGYAFARFIQDQAITVWYSVPSMLMRITEQQERKPLDLSSLRVVIFAGEPYPKSDLRRLHAVMSAPRPRLYNWYGPTETNVCTSHRVQDSDIAGDGPLPIGRACPYSQIRIAADGELLVAGGSLLSGYMRAGRVDDSVLELVCESDRDRYYRTGDFASADAFGVLSYHGRRDAQLKRNGYRIEAGEIEEATRALDGVAEAAVVLVDQQLHLFVSWQRPDREHEVMPWLSARLPPYMLPDAIRTVAAMPRNERGKVDLVQLRARVEDTHV